MSYRMFPTNLQIKPDFSHIVIYANYTIPKATALIKLHCSAGEMSLSCLKRFIQKMKIPNQPMFKIRPNVN
jgi:hypothetical protein